MGFGIIANFIVVINVHCVLKQKKLAPHSPLLHENLHGILLNSLNNTLKKKILCKHLCKNCNKQPIITKTQVEFIHPEAKQLKINYNSETIAKLPKLRFIFPIFYSFYSCLQNSPNEKFNKLKELLDSPNKKIIYKPICC